MLAAFLPPYPFRGVRAPYLWLYYRLLTKWAGESAMFITGREYIRPVEEWNGRWECAPEMQSRLGYRLPEHAAIDRHEYQWLDESRFEQWLAAAGHNPIAAFRYFLTERDNDFEQELRRLLAKASAPVEALVSICNVPSLEAVCAELGIPVVHVELGALRAPLFWETSYVDFQGVNGHTESAGRYEAFDKWDLPLARTDLFQFFARTWRPVPPDAQPDHELGVVLQVEDDSNLVAFSNGMDNIGLLTVATNDVAPLGECPLVRAHPGSSFGIRTGRFHVDESPSSPLFIQRCRRILTINSSVGLEAVLLDKPVQVFGESSFDFILSASDEAEVISRLAFYLLAYLVPFPLQLDPEYLRFRIARPAEELIILRHLEKYLELMHLDAKMFAGSPVAERVALSVLFANQSKTFEEALAKRDGQISALRQALSEQDGHTSALTRTLSDREGQIASLTQAVLEREGQLSALTHTLSEHVGQIFALAQVVSERDEQFSVMTQAVSERDERVSALTHAMTERDEKIEALLSSSSWRMTKAWRFFGRLLRGA
ncbi:GT99 family glycosyltransferase N-terminal domain-containing protein [Caballeronia insecticola]|uniref:Capsule polysaccharide biosynthesis protein n=1 Tax=Caballeronia insecticola TaxID=758793 RepID=R4WKA8_9BURK|nr:capsule polysaccharide biosynthesis protein [Caballeronia insecticola]BAN24874.1 capsule polysaccharide biosynthesis protein [Caballeronia insecticola]